jgi:hypothetical protein
MKGKSSSLLCNEFPALRTRFWGRHVWARGYFCQSSGNVTDEVIKAYIEHQAHSTDEVFRIEGESAPSGDTPLGDSPTGDSPSPEAYLSRSASGLSRNLDFSRSCEATAL